MNVLILAAGSEYHTERWDGYPFLLAEIEGVMLIELLLRNCVKLNPSRIICAVREEDIKQCHIDSVIKLIVADSHILEINRPTKGAACTALLAIEQLTLDDELLIMNAGDLVQNDLNPIIENFRNKDADGGMVVFDSLHPRYSFVRMDNNGHVLEVAEKRPISRNATAGVYWFRKASDFIQCCQNMIFKDAQVNGRFYISLIFNEMILKQKIILATKIPQNDYRPIKSDKQIAAIESQTDHVRVH